MVDAPGPLAGLRVLDVTHVLAGSYCSLLLADMGADVVKVEPRSTLGDRSGMSAGSFNPVNRNKRSLAIDLKSDEGRAVMLRLAGGADVFVQNFRPGAMERMGLGYETLRAINPGIVYCSISGYGGTGPYRDRPGFDLVAQAASGVMSLNGDPDRPPTKTGVPIGDLNAGMFGALGILSALVSRASTGHGQHVDTSLLEAALAYTVWDSSTYFSTGVVPTRSGSAHRLTAPYEVYRSKDGHFVIGAANQATWLALLDVIGRPELGADPRFLEADTRVRNREALGEILDAEFARETTERWCALLLEAGVPAGPINDIAQAWADPQIRAREMRVDIPTADGVESFIGPPVKLSDTPWRVAKGVAALGEDTVDVLREAGYSAEEIAALVERGRVSATAGAAPSGPS